MNHAFLVVLGNHYAGTSATAAWLQQCGICMNLLPKINLKERANDAGHTKGINVYQPIGEAAGVSLPEPSPALFGLLPERNPATLHVLSKRKAETFNLIILNNHRVAIALFARDSLFQTGKKYKKNKITHLWWNLFAKHAHYIHLRIRLIKKFIKSYIEYNDALLHYIKQTPLQNRLIITIDMLSGYEKSIFSILDSQFQQPMQYKPVKILGQRIKLREIKRNYCWFPNKSALLQRLGEQEKLLKTFVSYSHLFQKMLLDRNR